jgi:hypothetical protein
MTNNQLTVSRLVKKLAGFYRTRIFVTVLTRACQIIISVPNTHNLAKNNNRQTKQVQRTGEWNMCYVQAKGSTSDPDSNIIYGSNSKVTITKSNKTQPAPEYIYTTAKICNSWHMFNFKKLFKLQIRPPSLILLISTSHDRWIFLSQIWEVRNSMLLLLLLLLLFNCSWVVTWWQWLFYMYTKYEAGY